MANRSRVLGGTNWGGSFLQAKQFQMSVPSSQVTAKQQPVQADRPPVLIPATPIPSEPYRKVYNFPVTANEDDSKTIWINNHSVTIPDLDILASIPKE
ncbi:hypothetical protein SFC66_03520 [Terribacillus saccharophilus]|uniref:hypothetical protein n=1 Tax=Terribacillus saccharophilus TaxID=361277 RepID=UPI003981D415